MPLPQTWTWTSNPTTPPRILLPLTALLSLSYRLTAPLPLFRAKQRQFVAIHALATEGLQVLLAIFGVVHTISSLLSAFSSSPSLSSSSSPSCLSSREDFEPISTTTTAGQMHLHEALSTAAVYLLSLYAVDAIEAWIILSRPPWRGSPGGWQPFLLTRMWVRSLFVAPPPPLPPPSGPRSRSCEFSTCSTLGSRGIRTARKRSRSAPPPTQRTAGEDFGASCSQRHCRGFCREFGSREMELAGLEWLDLAVRSPSSCFSPGSPSLGRRKGWEDW